MLIASVLAFLFFVLTVESFLVHSNKSQKNPVNVFLSIHRILVQRKKFQAEDVIAFGGVGFCISMIAIILMSNLTINFGKSAGAQEIITPKVATSMLNKEANSPQVKVVKSYEEYVFDVVPAKVLPSIQWEAENFLVPAGLVYESADLSGGKAVRGLEKTEGDIAVSDPTTLQPKGDYEAVFYLKTSAKTDSTALATISVIDEHEGKVLFQRIIRGQDLSNDDFVPITGKFHRSKTGSVQVRVYQHGNGVVEFDKVKVDPISPELIVYDSEMEYYADIVDAKASEGRTRFASKDFDIPGRLAFGPYDDSLPVGEYVARFRLKIGDNKRTENIAIVDVSSNELNFAPGYRVLKPIDFENANEFIDFDVPFARNDANAYLEFRVYFYGIEDLYFDKVEILSGIKK